MRQADVFVFPSIRELGAGAVIEAMACGLVCAVVDYGAPGSLVTPECGVRIPLTSKETLIENYAQALGDLATDRAKLTQMSKAAYTRAMDHFSWEAKARKTVEVYKWALGQRATMPSFDEIPEHD